VVFLTSTSTLNKWMEERVKDSQLYDLQGMDASACACIWFLHCCVVWEVLAKAQTLANCSSYEGRAVDALAQRADEGRGKRRNASGSCNRALIRRYPNGVTRRGE
jgi:hypothetical protein